MIFKGIQTSIAKKPYIFVIFQGGRGLDPLSPPLDLRMLCEIGEVVQKLVCENTSKQNFYMALQDRSGVLYLPIGRQSTHVHLQRYQ